MKKLYATQVFAHTQPDLTKATYEYKITKVLNATTPKIWDLLTQEQIDLYCNNDEWEVSIV